MNHLYQDIPRLYTALAEWTACMVYVILLKKRFGTAKTSVIAVFFLLIQTVFMIMTGNLPTVFWIPCMLVAGGLMYLLLYLTCSISLREAGYCFAKAFLLAEFTASLEWQIHTYFSVRGIHNWWFSVLLLAGIYGTAAVVSFFMERQVVEKKYLQQVSGKELISAIVIAFAVFAFSNLSFIISNSPFSSQMEADIFNLRTVIDFGGLAILFAFQSRICEYIAEKELDSIEAAFQSQYDQYRNYQDSMEMMHIMYHDLKHQIAGLRAESDGAKRTQWLDTMENELERNSPMRETGNHVLDAILGGKILHAKRNQIQITSVADGTLLSFMHVTDICTIFGNALDNAIESVVFLENPEKRLIHLTVCEKQQFIFIQVRNYCESSMAPLNGQLPVTTKADKKKHGYGLKSIRYSAEKYGGNMSVDFKKNWFELTVLIPKGRE